MAQLKDTLIAGDLRVTGNTYINGYVPVEVTQGDIESHIYNQKYNDSLGLEVVNPGAEQSSTLRLSTGTGIELGTTKKITLRAENGGIEMTGSFKSQNVYRDGSTNWYTKISQEQGEWSGHQIFVGATDGTQDLKAGMRVDWYNTDLYGNIRAHGNLTPYSDNSYILGNYNKRWSDFYTVGMQSTVEKSYQSKNYRTHLNHMTSVEDGPSAIGLGISNLTDDKYSSISILKTGISIHNDEPTFNPVTVHGSLTAYNLRSTYYLTCSTGASTVAKIAKLTETEIKNVPLFIGTILIVKFTNSNTAANPTLTIQAKSTTTNYIAAKSIKQYGTTAPGNTVATSWRAGAIVMFVYDGTNWVMVSSIDNDTTYTHPTGAGNNHIPSGGSSGDYLKYSSSGVATWAALPTASTSAAGIIQIGTASTNAAAGNHTHSDLTQVQIVRW